MYLKQLHYSRFRRYIRIYNIHVLGETDFNLHELIWHKVKCTYKLFVFVFIKIKVSTFSIFICTYINQTGQHKKNKMFFIYFQKGKLCSNNVFWENLKKYKRYRNYITISTKYFKTIFKCLFIGSKTWKLVKYYFKRLFNFRDFSYWCGQLCRLYIFIG